MYENPITQDNLNICRKYGMHIIEPASGYLACGDTGAGKAAKVLKGEKKASEMNFEVIEEAAFYGNNKVAENLGITIPAELSDNAAALFDEITTN